MLEFIEQKFKISMINMLWTLMDKIDSMHEPMGSINREIEILRKNKK